MKDIVNEQRQRLGRQLQHASQDEVMSMIPQFFEAEVHNSFFISDDAASQIHALVFNMERGVHLEELGDFLQYCPEIQPFDFILANELDDGCARSGQLDTVKELSHRLQMNYVFGLEFIELVDPRNTKGYHGNAIFSRWPIRHAKIIRLPEQYNWYFDRQKRIGGRLAILAELEIGGRPVGVGTIHLENRTDSFGRETQLRAVLDAAEEMFRGMPVILGGDLNTNTFDGRDKAAINEIAHDTALQQRCLEDVFSYETCLPLAVQYGYHPIPDFTEDPSDLVTRRKPLPDGSCLGLRLDWLLIRDTDACQCRTISTCRDVWSFAPEDSALSCASGIELSDHNAVWFSGRLHHN